MMMMYHEPPDGPRKTAEGAEARALVGRALTQVGADLDELSEHMPDAIDAIREEKRKLRRRAVDALHRGEHIATRTDADGYPLGGMILAKLVPVVGIIGPDGGEKKL